MQSSWQTVHNSHSSTDKWGDRFIDGPMENMEGGKTTKGPSHGKDLVYNTRNEKSSLPSLTASND